MTDPHTADRGADTPAGLPDELRALQRVLDAEIPMAASMGVRVEPAAAGDALGNASGNALLTLSMPLDRNRNHQQTAFAGSLNALCTLVGWGATFLELRRLGAPGVIVIRRSAIKYHQPVDSPVVRAACLPIAEERRRYFSEMLATKGQSKLDLEVAILDERERASRAAVAFSGSYVVLDPDQPSGFSA